MRNKKILFYLIGWLISITIALVIGEMAARYFGLSKTWESYIARKNILQEITTDKKTGYTRVPNKTFIAPRDKTFVINSYGFRDKEFSLSKNKNVIRIAILGDSVTEGFGVEQEQRFGTFAENLLNLDFKAKFEILNFGVSGYCTYDELDILKNKVLPLNPDYVILQFGFNDIRLNILKYDLLNTASNINTHLLNQRNESKQPTEANDSHWLKLFLQENSAFYLFLAEHYNTYKLRRNQSNSILDNVLQTKDHDFQITDKIFRKVIKVCLNNNIKLAIMYIPLDVEVQIKDAEKGNFINSKLKAFCTKNNVAFIEVVNLLRTSKTDNLFLDDCHLSVSGHKIVGEKLADYIKLIY